MGKKSASKVVREVSVEFSGTTTKLGAALKEVRGEMSRNNAEINALKKSLEFEWDNEKFLRALELTKQNILKTRDAVDLQRQALEKLRTAGYEETSEEIQQVRIDLEKAENAAKKAEKELENLARIRFDGVVKSLEEAQQRINGIANAMLPMSGAAAAGLVGAGKAAIDFEDALAGVAKTTDLTDAGVKAMGEEIRNLALVIPTAATDLAKITETAGQLGIKNENLVSFTRIMADLGVATDMAGDSAAMTLAPESNLRQSILSPVAFS